MSTAASGCLSCPAQPPACPSCKTGTKCVTIAQGCQQCSQNVCRATDSSSTSSGGPSVGATVGGALGGVLGILAALALIYWFWWKPRGLAASRRRYSKHVTARQSRMPSTATEKKGSTSPQPQGSSNALKRSSVHLRMDDPDSHLTRRPTTPGGGDDSNAPSSAGATGAHTPHGSVDFEVDNPFGDHARSSVGTSDYSFRSSHSTNIIPIAYIPPHSNSVSLEDQNRGAYGELLHEMSPNPERIMGGRRSIPASVESRDSLALAGADQIHLHPLPPVLSLDSPLVPLSASAGGAPIRPPRSPGLDLQLPKGALQTTTSPLMSPTTPPNPDDDRPPSGFPWGTQPPTGSNSHFSLATTRTSANSYLSAADARKGSSSRGMSYLAPGANGLTPSQQSHLSTMSSMSGASGRSVGSTMSYILDPPQIITPVNAQGLRRVDILGREQAGLVRLPGTTAPGSSSTPTASSPLASPPMSASTTTTARPFDRQQEEANPFADNAAEEIDDSRSSARWTMSSSGSRMSVAQIMTVSPSAQAALAASAGSNGPQSHTNSFYDVPQSARSSAMSVGDQAWSQSSASRESFASSRSGATDSLSILDGVPFMQSPGVSSSSSDLSRPPRSPLFPMPPNRAPSLNPPSPPTTLADLPHSDHRGSTYSYETGDDSDRSSTDQPLPPHAATPTTSTAATGFLAQAISADSESRGSSPLPPPFLPFAGQRPSSKSSSAEGGGGRVQSQAMSVRSGFGSGLSQIPFQLGFPSGFDGSSERGSIITMDSRVDSMVGSRDSLGLGLGRGNGEYDDSTSINNQRLRQQYYWRLHLRIRLLPHREPISVAIANSHRELAAEVTTQTSQQLYTITSSGKVVVRTTIITATVTSEAATGSGGGKSLNGSDTTSRSFFSNTGAVAGTFAVVGLVIAALLLGLAFFFLRRKRARQLDEDIRVAAGGAGDGGAGVNRFSGEDDDEDDPYLSGGSDTHGAYQAHQRALSMTSNGAPVMTAAAAGFYDHGTRRNDTVSPVQSDHGYLPPGASLSRYQPQPGPYGAPGAPANPNAARSSEGVMYADWAQYVDGDVMPGSSGETSPQEQNDSAEGMIGGAESQGHSQGHSQGYSQGHSQLGHSQGHSLQGHSSQKHSPAFNHRLSSDSYYGAPPPMPMPPAAAYDPKPDDRLDPRVLPSGASQRSFGDENDYSRPILRVVNAED
ncbi:hypothetical protein RQP46_009378 [Phenoliferia psychrophenolica]